MRIRSAVAAVAVLALGIVVPAPAQAAPASGGTSIAVGGPAEPVELRAGGSVTTNIRISNGTDEEARVALNLATLTPGNDGRLDVVDHADPAWAGRVSMPAQIVIPGQGSRDIPVRVDAPPYIPADYYLIGVVAEPVIAAPAEGVQVNGRVAAVLTVNVPGVRARKVETALGSLPSFRFASKLTGSVDVHNAGEAGAMTRTQIRINDEDGQNLAVLPVSGEALQLLPAGTKRTLNYTWKANSWLTVVRPQSDVSFLNEGDIVAGATTRGRSVVLIAPQFVVVATVGLVVLIAVVTVLLVLRRRRLSAVPPRHSAATGRTRKDAK